MNEIVGMIVHADSNVTEGTLYYIFDSIMNKLGHKDVFFYSKRCIELKLIKKKYLLKIIHYWKEF